MWLIEKSTISLYVGAIICHKNWCETFFFRPKLLRGQTYGDHTLSKTLYHRRKIEPVTMKANFIHFWCVESEFMIKNWFHNWTSELGCIWHIFGKFGSFQALQHWQQPAAANKLSLVDSDVDSYLNIRIFQKEPKIA